MNSLAPRIDHHSERNLTLQIAQATSRVSRRAQWHGFVGTLVVSDMLMAALAFRLAYFIRFDLPLELFRPDAVQAKSFYENLSLVFLVPLWTLLFWIVGLYKRQNLLGGVREYALIFRATTIGLLAVIIAGFLQPDLIIARGWLLMAWGLTFLLTASSRFWLRRAVYYLRQHGFFVAPTVIVGANEEGHWLANQLKSWKTSGLHVVGFVDEKVRPGTALFNNLRALGSVEQLDDIIKQYQIEELILATSSISSRNKLLEIFRRYGIDSSVNVRMSSGLYEIITTGLTVNEFAYVPLVGVNKIRLTGMDEILKISLDYLLTLPGLIVILPLMAVLAGLIKLDSPGPVIHRRRVMGMNGIQFDAYKFRTMHVNGDEILAARPELKAELDRTHKIKNDPRITRLGRFLRKYSLDEFPQLFNVLRREMSLVGPRMISPSEMRNYEQWGINLLTVRPGITGLWQVSGRSDVSYEERVRLDMHYIRNWNIWLDLQLLMQTPMAVIRGRGAY